MDDEGTVPPNGTPSGSPVIVLGLPSSPGLADALARALQVPRPPVRHRRFPDGETYLRLPDVAGSQVLVVADLSSPDAKVLELLFLADAARNQGALGVTLVAPYLPYMRQDARFHAGEAITSRTFARLLGQAFDVLYTIEPHLHRVSDLREVYDIEAHALTATPRMAAWVLGEAAPLLLVGPDAESEQWVAPVAAGSGREHLVMHKDRRGDYDVVTCLPEGANVRGRNCVLVDDIASTGRTLIDAAQRLQEAGAASVDALVVHAVLAGDAWDRMRQAGIRRLVSTNSIPHETSCVDVVPLLAAAIARAHHLDASPA